MTVKNTNNFNDLKSFQELMSLQYNIPKDLVLTCTRYFNNDYWKKKEKTSDWGMGYRNWWWVDLNQETSINHAKTHLHTERV